MRKSAIVLVLQTDIKQYCDHFIYYSTLLKMLNECYGDDLVTVERKIQDGISQKGKEKYSKFIYELYKKETIRRNKDNKLSINNGKEIIINDVKFLEIMEKYFKCKLVLDNIEPGGELITFKKL